MMRISVLVILIWTAVSIGCGQAQSKATLFGERFCEDSRFTCRIIEKGETWESLWPDAETRDLVMRLNRMDVRLREGMTIAVPKDASTLVHTDIAPFAKKIEAPGEKQIRISLSQLAWVAYDAEGRMMHWGPVSGGKEWCHDIKAPCLTPTGRFHVYRKEGAGCKSGKFPLPNGGAPMPYCMFFEGGYAIHGSHDVPGYNASHGCVRVFPDDAGWLNENFVELPDPEIAFPGTTVLINP